MNRGLCAGNLLLFTFYFLLFFRAAKVPLFTFPFSILNFPFYCTTIFCTPALCFV